MPTGATGPIRGPLCDGWPVHDISVEPGPARSSPAAAARGTALPSGGATTWARRGRHSSEGLTYGDDGPKVATVWNVTAGTDGIYAGVEPAGLFRSLDRRRRDVGARRGPDEPPQPARVGAGRRRADPPLDRPPPHRRRPDVGRDLGGRRVRDAGRRRDLGDPQQGRPRRVQPGEPLPRLRAVRPQARHGRRRRRAAVPAEPLRRLPLDRRRRASGRRSRAACRATSASSMAAHPRDPHDRLDHPAHRSRAGTPDARRRTPRSGGPTTAATRGSGPATACPRRTRSSACCARRWRIDDRDPVGVYFGTSSGQVYGIGRRGPDVEPDRGQPAADLERRGARP